MSRTQDPPAVSDRPLPRRRRPLARRHNLELLESGRRYALGRRGDVYCIWEKGTRGEMLEHSWESNARQEFRWLERQDQRRRSRRLVRLSVGLALVLTVAASVAIGLYARDWFPSTEQSETTQIEATDRYVNAPGGYAFRIPEGWNVGASGPTTEVTSPTGAVTVSIQTAPDGDIVAASQDVAEGLTMGWTGTEFELPRARSVGDQLPASSIGGTAVDSNGDPLRFLSIVVDSGASNHAITVRVPDGQGLAETSPPAIEELLSSFKPVDAS